MTFSVVGRDSESGMMGVAVATKHTAVGARVPYVRAGAAAIAVQAYAQPYLGYDALRLIQDGGVTGPQALDTVLAADPGRDWRQVILVDAEGRLAGHTGVETEGWSGHRLGTHCAAAGNMLVNGETVEAMVAYFESHPDDPLPLRLVAALQAGHAAGGDRRGQQSAALYVVYREEAPYADLRIDDHPQAVGELRRLLDLVSHDALTMSLRFSSGRESPPVSEYIAHKDKLRRAGLA
ncbi:MAG: DUF1028 domain-containing protein [Anaerolineae bacterium]